LPDRIFYGKFIGHGRYRQIIWFTAIQPFRHRAVDGRVHVSLAAHLVAYGGYEIGKSLHLSLPHFLTKKSRQFRWFKIRNRRWNLPWCSNLD